MTKLLSKATPVALLALALLSGGAGLPAWAAPASQTAPLRLAQDDPAPQADGVEDPADSSGMVVRIGRLEGQIRTLTGQIEQLQFENKRLEGDLRKMQGDVDFRFQDLQRQQGGTQGRPAPLKRSDADTPAPATADVASDATPATPPATARARPARTANGDAFDPDSDPNAPGAPQPLGSTAASAPIGSRPASRAASNAPLDLMQRPAAAPADAETPAVIPAPPGASRDAGAVASLVPGGTREEYDADLSLYKQGQFDAAATGFQAFASKYPRDRLVPDAVFLAGESYSRLGRHREAAEQFLKVSTDYGKSPRGADALLRLGMSLNALGAKDQACATYLEVPRRYPTASAEVRGAVDRELKRARCPENG